MEPSVRNQECPAAARPDDVLNAILQVGLDLHSESHASRAPRKLEEQATDGLKPVMLLWVQRCHARTEARKYAHPFCDLVAAVDHVDGSSSSSPPVLLKV